MTKTNQNQNKINPTDPDKGETKIAGREAAQLVLAGMDEVSEASSISISGRVVPASTPSKSRPYARRRTYQHRRHPAGPQKKGQGPEVCVASNKGKVVVVYYFAFGSNMNQERMSSRGVNFSRRLKGTLIGFRLNFDKMAGWRGVGSGAGASKQGFANVELCEGRVVEGVVYETDEVSIASLDKFEGVPHHYFKALATVMLEDGSELETLVYVARPDKVKKGLLPSREYLDHLLAGREFLSPDYYAELANWETVAVPAPARVKSTPTPTPTSKYTSSLKAREWLGDDYYSTSTKASFEDADYIMDWQPLTGSARYPYTAGGGSFSGKGVNFMEKSVNLGELLNALELEPKVESSVFYLAAQAGEGIINTIGQLIEEAVEARLKAQAKAGSKAKAVPGPGHRSDQYPQPPQNQNDAAADNLDDVAVHEVNYVTPVNSSDKPQKWYGLNYETALRKTKTSADPALTKRLAAAENLAHLHHLRTEQVYEWARKLKLDLIKGEEILTQVSTSLFQADVQSGRISTLVRTP